MINIRNVGRLKNGRNCQNLASPVSFVHRWEVRVSQPTLRMSIAGMPIPRTCAHACLTFWVPVVSRRLHSNTTDYGKTIVKIVSRWPMQEILHLKWSFIKKWKRANSNNNQRVVALLTCIRCKKFVIYDLNFQHINEHIESKVPFSHHQGHYGLQTISGVKTNLGFQITSKCILFVMRCPI